MGPVTFIALLAALLTGAANVESQRRVIGREPPSTDGWRPVAGSTEQPRYSTQAVGHPVLDKLRAHLEDAERRKPATTPTPSVLASFSAVGPRRDQNAGFSGRLVPPPRDQPPPAAFPQDTRGHGHSQDLSPASQTHPGPYYLHSLLPPPRASDFLLEGPGAPATSYVSFPPFSSDAYFGGAKEQPAAPQLQFFPQAQPQAQAQQDVFGSLPQRQTYYLQQQPQQYQQPQQQQQQYQQPQQTQQYQQQQQQPQQPDYLLSTQHRQHPSAVSSHYTSHQAVSAASPGFGAGQTTSVFGGRDPVSATPRPQAPAAATHTPTAPSSAGSVTFHGGIRDQAAYLSAASLASPSQGHRFETRRPGAGATASLGSYTPGPAPTAATQSAVALFHHQHQQQQAHTPSYADIPVGTSAGVVGYTLGVAANDGAATGNQLETPAQRAHHYLQVQQQQQQQQQQRPAQTFQQQPNSVQRPDGPTTSDKPARKRRPPAAQKKPTAAEEARRPPQPQPPPRQQDPYFQQQQQQQQYQPEVQQQQQQQQPVSWPPTAPQRQVPSAPEAPHQQVATQQQGTPPGQRHGGRRRPPQAAQPEASTHTPVQYQEEPGPRTTPRQHARRPPHRQQFGPSAQAPTSTPQLEQPTAQGEYRPHRRRRPTQSQQEQPAVTAPGQQYSAPQQEAAIRQQQAFYQNTAAIENAPTAPGAAGEIPSAPSAPASADTQPPRQYIRRRPQNKQKYHITMDNDKRAGGSSDWEQTQNTVKPARPHTRRPAQEQNTEVNFATEENTGNGNIYSQPQLTAPEGRPQQRRRPARPQHRNPPATSLNTYPVTENYPQTQKDEETYTNAVIRPEETPSEDAPPVPEQVQNQQVEQQVYTRRPSTRYSTTESVTEAATDFQDEEQSGQRTRVRQQQRRPSTRYSTTESVTEAAIDTQDEEQSGQRTRVRQQHVSRRPAQPTVEKEMTTVIHYRRPLHPSRRPLYKKGAARPIRPPPEYETDSAGQQEATNEPISQSDNSGDYVQDYRLAESKKVQRQRYKRPQVSPNLDEDVPVRTAAVEKTPYQLQSNSPLDAEDNYAVDQPTVPAPPQKVCQRINQQGLTRGKNKYHRDPPSETDTPLPESTEQLYVETPVQTEPDFENDVLGGGGDARFPSAVDYTPEEEESDSEPPAVTTPSTTTTSTTTTTTTTTTTPAPATTRPPSSLEKLRQRSRYNATRPRFSVRDFQERLHRLSTSTPAPEPEPAQPAAPASRYSGRQRSTTAAPEDQEAGRPRPAARDPARVNSARYRASTPATTTAVTPSTRYKYKSRYRSTFSTSSTTTEDPTTVTTTTVATPTPSALVSRPSLRTKGIFSAVRPNPLLRMSSTLGTTTTTTTPPPPPTSSVAAEFTNEADEPTAPSAPSAPGVFGVRTPEPSPTVDDELSQSRRIAELTLAAGSRAPSSVATAATSQPPQHTTDLLSAYWAQQDSSVSPSISTNPSPSYIPFTEDDDQPGSATTPDAASYPSTAADSVADQSSTSQLWSDDAVPPTQMITDLTSSASPSDFFHKSMTSKHSLRITMATDDPILPLEAFFPSWGGKEDSHRR